MMELILMVFSMWFLFLFFILFYFIFLYAKITMVGGNRWIWIMAIVDVGCGHGSDSE